MTTTRARSALGSRSSRPARRSRASRLRRFIGDADYERLAALIVPRNAADDVPWLPTAENVRIEMEAADGADPVDDVVLVEVDGRVVAAAGVERVIRDDVPTYEVVGRCRPSLSASRASERG